MSENYITSKTGLAEFCGVNRSTVYKWVKDTRFPVKTKTGWPVDKVEAYAVDALERAAQCQTGGDADLKRLKLERQIELINSQIRRRDFELARDRGEYIRREEMREGLRAALDAVRHAVDCWHSTTQTITASEKGAYAIVQRYADDLRRAICDNVRSTLSDASKPMSERDALFNVVDRSHSELQAILDAQSFATDQAEALTAIAEREKAEALIQKAELLVDEFETRLAAVHWLSEQITKHPQFDEGEPYAKRLTALQQIRDKVPGLCEIIKPRR